MVNFKRQNILLFFALSVFAMLSISFVCAADINGSAVNDDVDCLNFDELSSDNLNIHEVSSDNVNNNEDKSLNNEPTKDKQVLSSNNNNQVTINLTLNETNMGSFTDLNNEIKNIKSYSIFNLKRDYKYNDGDNAFKTGINIKTNYIVFNGNGHIIDASGMAGIFNVKGDGVFFYNVTFVNSGYTDITSSGNLIKRTGYTALNWQGDKGRLENCVFCNNKGLNGGAIVWTGNDGYISDVTLINCISSGFGGGIYIAGNDNLLKNSNFINCISLMGYDSIFISGKSQSNRVEKIECDAPIKILNGSSMSIDVDYLNCCCNITVAEESFDIIPILFYQIAHDTQVFYIYDLAFYLDYSEKTKDFVLSVYRDFSDGFSYKKVFHIPNIESPNDVFNGFFNHKFTNELTFIKHINIASAADYEKAIKYNRDDLYNDPAMESIIFDFWDNPADSMVYALDLKFIKPITINTHSKWNTAYNRFDVININGNGSKIFIENRESNEFHWASLAPNCVFSVENMVIQGYNTAIEILGGSCILNNVTLDGNRLNYMIKRDWGGAILNAGFCLCTNCTFSNNYAKHGGAIFNQGLLQINNCTFTNNQAYGKGNDVFSADDAIVMLNGEKIENTQGIITHAKSLSSVEKTAIKISTYVASFCVGFIVGFFTANPTIGALAGAGVGAALGTISATCIIAYTYDINFNRFATAFEIISTSITAGMIGGAIGGGLGKIYKVVTKKTYVEGQLFGETTKDVNGETYIKAVGESAQDIQNENYCKVISHIDNINGVYDNFATGTVKYPITVEEGIIWIDKGIMTEGAQKGMLKFTMDEIICTRESTDAFLQLLQSLYFPI